MTTSNTSDSEAINNWRNWLQTNEPELDNLLYEYRQAVRDERKLLGDIFALERKILQWSAQEANKARIDEWRKTTAYIQESFGFDWYPADFKAYRDTRVKELTSQNHLEDRT